MKPVTKLSFFGMLGLLTFAPLHSFAASASEEMLAHAKQTAVEDVRSAVVMAEDILLYHLGTSVAVQAQNLLPGWRHQGMLEAAEEELAELIDTHAVNLVELPEPEKEKLRSRLGYHKQELTSLLRGYPEYFYGDDVELQVVAFAFGEQGLGIDKKTIARSPDEQINLFRRYLDIVRRASHAFSAVAEQIKGLNGPEASPLLAPAEREFRAGAAVLGGESLTQAVEAYIAYLEGGGANCLRADLGKPGQGLPKAPNFNNPHTDPQCRAIATRLVDEVELANQAITEVADHVKALSHQAKVSDHALYRGLTKELLQHYRLILRAA